MDLRVVLGHLPKSKAFRIVAQQEGQQQAGEMPGATEPVGG